MLNLVDEAFQMLEGLLGKKVGMTQVFTEAGLRLPVTVIELGPVTVIQKKTDAKDGYNAVQVGYQTISEGKRHKVSKALQGHFGEAAPTKILREFKTDSIDAIEVGQTIDLSMFEKGQKVDVVGTSKGRGFAGVMKRHNFKGGPGAHGHRFHRGTGSIGGSATPARVFKNKKMPGHYGNTQVTVQGLEIVDIRPELNAILVKGGIPGPSGRLVEVKFSKK
ncbi:MAG: large subunit ribosomal protein L3 [bacterium]|jgi:large subunit ribosomal protein L3